MARARFDKDYYRVMELSPGAGEDEIRRAYRRLALRWHPDRNPGDPAAAERFVEISEAYAVLIDAGKRREYDAVRSGARSDFHHSRDEIFRDLFADPRASAVFEELAREFARMGMRVDSHTFHQTLFGGRTVVTGGVFVITPFTPLLAAFRLARAAMRGTAPAPVDTREARALSRPGGVLRAMGRAARWFLGVPAPHAALRPGDIAQRLAVSAAEAAHGARRRVTLADGGGADEVLVTIPAGVRQGTRLRLRGKGRPGPDGAPGDAYLVVDITG